MSDRAQLRLLPKIKPVKFRRGAPFVFSNELVMDRRARAIAPGAIATLVDNERTPLATVAVNPASKIAGRVLDLDPDAAIDTAWLKARLGAALQMREALYDAPFYRLCHGEGDGLSGLVVDRYGDTFVMKLYSAAWFPHLPAVVGAIVDRFGPERVVLRFSRAVAGGETWGLRDGDVMHGAPPSGPVTCSPSSPSCSRSWPAAHAPAGEP